MLDIFRIRLPQLLARFRRDEDGAALVEYGMLIALIAGASLLGITLVGTSLQTFFNAIGTWIGTIPTP